MRRALAAALLLLATVSGAQHAPPDVAAVDEYLGRAEAFGFAGGVVVSHRGKILLDKGYGLADRRRNVRVTSGTLFDIGSITKTYTAMAVHQLIDQKKLSLDDTLPKFFGNVPEDKRAITVSQLMTHSAGLPLYTGDDFELVGRDEMVARAFKEKLAFEPGTKWAYCNSCYQLLAVMIETMSGKAYEQYVHDHLLAPAGIGQTGYVIPNFLDDVVAVGYWGETADGSPLEKAWYGDGPSWNLRGGGGFLAPLRDVAAWADALRGNAIASDEAKKRAWTPARNTNHDDEQIGHGWYVRDTPYGRQASHSGGNGYFAMHLRRYLDRDVVIVFATNNAGFDWTHESEVVARLFGAGKRALAPKAAVTLPPEALARIAGRYRFPSGREVELRVIRGQLSLDPLAAPELLSVFATPPATVDTPQAREVAAKGVHVFTRMAAGDFEPLAKGLPPSVAAEGEREFWKGWFERTEKDLGKFVAAAPLWVVQEGEQLNANLTLQFANGARVVQMQQRKDGLFAHARGSVTLPDRFRFVAQSPNELVAWNPFSGATAALRVDGEAIVIGTLRATRVQP
jgi:CubicO group peptidase (beta-lactamase class C family)